MNADTITNKSTEDQINYVSHILHQFYNFPSKENQEAYERLLTSDVAWNLCPLMLDPTKTHANIQFFGASVLFSRIARLSYKINVEERIQLRSNLIIYISRYATTGGHRELREQPPRHVYTRLCVALVRLAMKMNSDGQWENPIEDMCTILAQCNDIPPNIAHQTVCKLLGLFSEELKTHQQTVITDDEGRKHRLVASASFVFQLIEQNLQGTDNELQCLSSWARLGVSLTLFSPKLLDFMFGSLKQTDDPELSENACDCLTELLTTSVANNYSNRIWTDDVLPRILQLSATIHLATSLTIPIDDDFMDHLVRLVKVFSIFLENHAVCITSTLCTVPVRMAVFNFLIECVSFPGQFPNEERISELTLSSWYAISDEFCIDEDGEDDGFDEDDIDDEEKFEISAFSDRAVIQSPLIEEVKPYFCSCVRAMTRKCCFAKDPNTFNSEEDELFRIYRINVSDIINFSLCILKHECFNVLVDTMQRAVHAEDWPLQESCLYLLGALIEQEDIEEYVINWLLEITPLLKFEIDERFLTTGIIFIGQLAEALNAVPNCLPYAIQFCMKHLTNHTMVMHASMSLRSIARENRENLSDLVEPIVSACAHIIDNSVYDQNDRSRCMAVIGYALSFVSPAESLLNCFESVVAPFVRRLLDRLNGINDSSSSKEMKDLMFDFSLISNFVCSFTTPVEETNTLLKTILGENCTLLLNGLLPILTNIVKTKYCSPEIFECCIEIFSRFLSFLEHKFEQFLPNVSELILNQSRSLSMTKYSLNFVRQSCILFQPASGSNQKYIRKCSEESSKLAQNLFVEAVTRSLQHITKTDSDYLVEFVLFLQQIARVRVHLIEQISDDLFRSVLEMLTQGIQLNEQSTVKSCSDCMVVLIRMPRGRKLLALCGEQLCNIIVQCVVLQTPTVCLEYVLKTLLSLARREESLPLTMWMRKIFAQEMYFRATNIEKEKFIMVITREHGDKEKCFKAAMQFSKLARDSWTENKH